MSSSNRVTQRFEASPVREKTVHDVIGRGLVWRRGAESGLEILGGVYGQTIHVASELLKGGGFVP